MATQEDLDRQNSINLSIQERLALLEKERGYLSEEADLYKRLLGTNLDLSQVRSRYQSDEKDILQTIRTNTNILRDQSKQITFQVAEKSRIQKISNEILNISENSYSMLMEELGTSRNISDIEKKREILAKRLIELESFRGTILFEDKELQVAFNEELENSIKGAADLEAQLTDVQNASEKIQGNVKWFDALKETSNKIGLGKFTDAFTAAEEAARETAVANELSKKVANELVAAKEEEAAAINKITEAEKELQAIKAQEKEDKNKQRELSAAFQKEIEGRKGIAQLTQKELETGEGLTAERLKQLNLSEITGDTTGTAAKELIKQFKAQSQSRLESLRQAKLEASEAKKVTAEKKKGLTDILNQAKQEKTLSGNRIKGLKGQQQQLAKMTGKAGMKGITAGAKALVPILKKAMGPVSIILMVKDVIQFFVDAMFQASKTVAELRNNIGVSAKEANRIRHSFNDLSNMGNEFNRSQEAVLITAKQIQQSFFELNKLFGTTLDFTEDFGEEGQSLLRTFSLLRDNFKLSEGSLKMLSSEQIRTGRTAEKIMNSVAAELEFRNAVNDTSIDVRTVLEDISKLSYTIQATYGASVEKLAGAVYEARKLGFELDDLNSASSNLLDFENSIAKELEAELMLGKDLNLEKARQYALSGDLVGVGKELIKQDIDIVKLREENVLAAEAAAAAMGMSLDMAVKSQLAAEEQIGITKRLADLQSRSAKTLMVYNKEGKEVELTYAELQAANIKDLRRYAAEAQVDFDELAEVVGAQKIQSLQAEDAQAKFNKALEKVKEQFADLVGSGVIDSLAMGLAGIVDSWWFREITGVSQEQIELQKTIGKLEELQSEGLNIDQNLIDSNKELLNRIKEGESVDDVFGGKEGGAASSGRAIVDALQNMNEEDRNKLITSNQEIGVNESQQEVINEALANLRNVSDGLSAFADADPEQLREMTQAYTQFNPETGQLEMRENAEQYRMAANVSQYVGYAAGAYGIGMAGNYVGDYLTNTVTDMQTANSPSDYTTTRVDDAFILPDKKQIVIPDENDVMALFKPDGIISNTLSSTEDTTQQSFIEGISSFLNSIKFEISKPETNTNFSFVDTIKNSMEGISSLFNSFTSEPNPIPEPPEVDITELAKTNIIAAENYAEAMGMSLDALINKPTPPPEPTIVTDNSELVKEITQLRKELNQLNNRPVQVESTINLDGNKVATALGMSSYTVGS